MVFAVIAVQINEAKNEILNSKNQNSPTSQNSDITISQGQVQICKNMTYLLENTLKKSSLDSSDLQDALNYCLQAIYSSKHDVRDLRAAVFYIDKSGKYLALPDNGYYGYALDKDIKKLYFDISDRRKGEDKVKFLYRIGIAGWSLRNNQEVLDKDVQLETSNKKYRYKPFDASQKERQERSMICVCIPNLQPGEQGVRGVLSISSLTPNVFTKNDVALAHCYATILSKYKSPILTPEFILEAERKRH